MSLKLGNNDVTKITLGGQDVSVVYKGTEEVWSAGGSLLPIDEIAEAFSTYVYKGTGAALDIENGIDLAGEGGLVWIKSRSSSSSHVLADTERGNEYYLGSDSSAGQVGPVADRITSFNSNGFSLATNGNVNGGKDYVSWTFRKAAKFFDVVRYTGNGLPNHEIRHSLGCVPGMIITKRINGSGEWITWHRGDGVSSINTIWLNATDAANNGMRPISSVTDKSFKLDNYSSSRYKNNADGQEYVAYVFAHDDSDESVIKCGSFPGQYSDIDLGFEPQWVLMKPATSIGPWSMLDTARGWPPKDAGGTNPLRANDNSIETQNDTSLGWITSTGFHVQNVGAYEYIYMAIKADPTFRMPPEWEQMNQEVAENIARKEAAKEAVRETVIEKVKNSKDIKYDS